MNPNAAPTPGPTPINPDDRLDLINQIAQSQSDDEADSPMPEIGPEPVVKGSGWDIDGEWVTVEEVMAAEGEIALRELLGNEIVDSALNAGYGIDEMVEFLNDHGEEYGIESEELPSLESDEEHEVHDTMDMFAVDEDELGESKSNIVRSSFNEEVGICNFCRKDDHAHCPIMLGGQGDSWAICTCKCGGDLSLGTTDFPKIPRKISREFRKKFPKHESPRPEIDPLDSVF